MKKLKLYFKKLYETSGEKAFFSLEKLLLKDSIALLSNSFENYCKNDNKGDRKKRFLQYFYCTIGWLTLLRFSFAAFVRNPKILAAIGDPFYLTENQTLFNLLVASIALNSTLFRTLFLIGLYMT